MAEAPDYGGAELHTTPRWVNGMTVYGWRKQQEQSKKIQGSAA